MSRDYIWDSVQQYQINNLQQSDAARTEVAAQGQATAGADIAKLEERIDRLVLVCKATFELLAERSDVTDKHLADKILEVDMRDGKADGKLTPQLKTCPDCGAGICAKFMRCLFCGYKDTSGDSFTTV